MDNNQKDKESIAQRLRMIRQLTGLSRQQVHDRFGINSSSLKAWETAMNPIRPETVQKLICAYSQCNIALSEEWLVSGKGNPPVLKQYAHDVFTKSISKTSDLTVSHQLSEEEKILHESFLFESHYPHTEVMIVPDDTMLPCYHPGDTVGGLIYRGDLIHKAIGCVSIITLPDKQKLLRQLIKNEEQNNYVLSVSNPLTSSVVSNVFVDKIESVAPILWHRKKSSH